MTGSFTGPLKSDPTVTVTFNWTDGVFTADDPISKAYLPHFLEFAKGFESEWATVPGLRAGPPGDHTKTPVGVWFLMIRYLWRVSAKGDSDPNGVPTPPGAVE